MEFNGKVCWCVVPVTFPGHHSYVRQFPPEVLGVLVLSSIKKKKKEVWSPTMDSGVLGLGRTTVGWVGSLKGGVQSCEGANSK